MSSPSPHDLAVLPNRFRPHFAYLAERKILCPTVLSTLVRATSALMVDRPLKTGSIEVFSRLQFAGVDRLTAFAFDAVANTMGFEQEQGASIVCCRNALPHDDPTFSGEAFVSLVLDTGPSPYAFSAHSRIPRSRVGSADASPWFDTRRFLVSGDILVLDPTALHAAVPVYPTNQSALMLFQGFYPLSGRKDQINLLRRFPRHPFDRDETDDVDLRRHNAPLS